MLHCIVGLQHRRDRLVSKPPRYYYTYILYCADDDELASYPSLVSVSFV